MLCHNSQWLVWDTQAAFPLTIGRASIDEAVIDKFWDERVDIRLKELVEDLRMVGASVSAVSSSRVWTQVAGWADAERKVPLEPTAKFLIYSLTKTFIAVLVLRLVEAGQVDLDAQLSTYIKDVPFGSLVTIRQVLNHTSGLPDYGALTEYHEAVKRTPSRPWTEQEFLRRTWSGKLLFEPGADFAYSNIGYMMLRLMIEGLTGNALALNFANLIADPLGLTETRIVEDLQGMQELVWSQGAGILDDESIRDIRHHYHPGWVSHGVVASTAEEVARFYSALFEGSLIRQDLLQELTTMIPVRFEHPYFKNPGYGLGIMGDASAPNGSIFGHTGDGPGYCASAYHLRCSGDPLTIAVLCNSEGASNADSVLFALMQDASAETALT